MSSAILLSGGLDSAVLVAEEASRGPVQPVYVSVGAAWEALERKAVDVFCARMRDQFELPPVACLSVDMTDIYPAAHWSLQGRPPEYHTPDEDVYLPGRNIVLLSKTAVYCAISGLDRIVIGTLDHNPFPDATPRFRDAIATALGLGLDHPLQVDAPYARVEKSEVIRRGAALGVPLELTLSCMRPLGAAGGAGRAGRESEFPRHCGRCSKCRERHDAFVVARIDDPTDYADRSFVDL